MAFGILIVSVLIGLGSYYVVRKRKAMVALVVLVYGYIAVATVQSQGLPTQIGAAIVGIALLIAMARWREWVYFAFLTAFAWSAIDLSFDVLEPFKDFALRMQDSPIALWSLKIGMMVLPTLWHLHLLKIREDLPAMEAELRKKEDAEREERNRRERLGR